MSMVQPFGARSDTDSYFLAPSGWVTFSFAPADKLGHWQVDDFYVDPIKHH